MFGAGPACRTPAPLRGGGLRFKRPVGLSRGPPVVALPPVIGCVFDLTALSVALRPEAGGKLDKF